ncbi:MAG: gliding motility-associated C-terminal domain-containing protein [Prolixibacteraceae bacterium]|nr:gliding motility-associated C-terminal domain-containing protein [Prolixibacteraceae bacterium]
MMIVWMVSVANVTGQNFYSVYRGSVHEYKIPKAQGNYIYTWQVFTDANLTTQAVSSQVLMTPLGVGRENEIQVKWNTSGDYYLMVSVYTIAGCANRKAWHFVVDQTDDKPTARIAGSPVVTLGSCDTQGYILDGTTSTGGGLVFNWSPSAYLDNAASSAPRFLPGKTTRYHLTVTDSRGQKDTASVLIIVSDAPMAVTDKNVFVDAADNTILLNGSKSTGSSLTFEWTSKDGVILNGGTNPTVQVRGLGKYYLKVKDSFGCTSLDSVNVGLYIQAINDNIETNINKSVNINVLKNDIPQKAINPSTISIITPPMHGFASVSADSTILYQPDDYYIGQDELVYRVCDYFNNCDNATVLVFINDNPFFIPEAFSPNGDGINDKFEIKGIAKYKSVQIEIFNRWGNIVYQSKNYGEGAGKEGFWDGSSKSGPVPTGTYFYILRLDGKENINGSIYIDR